MKEAATPSLERFAEQYAAHRESEGRAHHGDELLSLPYLRHGPLAPQWAVRARSFEAMLGRVVRPMARDAGRPLRILDLGAGNGWLSYRLASEGHRCVAIDIRDDGVDGLGAATELRCQQSFECLVSPFEMLPLPDRGADLAVFNASLHYAVDLSAVLAEAARCVRPGGKVAVLDSPFYRCAADGEAMVAEKRAQAAERFGLRAATLLALPHIEYLTRERIEAASGTAVVGWRQHRVHYPLWYELRPLIALLKRARPPSRFDLWVAEIR